MPYSRYTSRLTSAGTFRTDELYPRWQTCAAVTSGKTAPGVQAPSGNPSYALQLLSLVRGPNGRSSVVAFEPAADWLETTEVVLVGIAVSGVAVTATRCGVAAAGGAPGVARA